MRTATVHPTQRRVSCEVCRRHKSRCQRLCPDDPKCARCTLLGVSCTAGQQRKIGRPRRTATSVKVSQIGRIVGHNQPETSNTIQEPLSWDIFDDPDEAFSLSRTDLASGIATSWLTGPGTTSSPANNISYAPANPPTIPASGQLAVDSIPTTDAIANLSKINLDLHIRLAAAEANTAMLNLNSVIYQQGPLYIDNLTLAEFMIRASQEFLLMLARLLGSRPTRCLACASQAPEATFPPQYAQESDCNATSVPLSSCPSAASAPLAAPLALTITSIFTQLISLYELILDHLTARIERIAVDPITPIPGLTFGGLPLAEPCTQGMLFSDAAVQTLQRIELSLGIGAVPEGGNLGLLSPRQVGVLSSELDGTAGVVEHAHGIARPANVRTSFEKVRSIFRRLAMGQWTLYKY